MYPKVWKALSRVATSERGYEEFAETLDRLETEQPVALRHAVQPQLAPPEARLAGRPGQLAGRRAHAAVPDQLDELRQPGRDRLPRLRRGRLPGRHALHERRGRRDPRHVRQVPQAPRPADRQRPLRRLVAAASTRPSGSRSRSARAPSPARAATCRAPRSPRRSPRRATPQVGSDLISPSNNHDLYSIEDLAQLIDELKTSNPHAKVIVKVPVVPGIGTIAIGIAKAGADVITMSGYDGGTGAARQHALRRAGLPCEIGTVLAHHALTEAGIRDRVEIWADGGLRSAADAHQAHLHGRQPARLRHRVDGRHRLHDLPRLPARHLPRRHRHPARRARGPRARPQALRAAGVRPVGRRPWCATSPRWARRCASSPAQMGVSEVQELVGQADRLVQVSHHDRLDLTSLLTPVARARHHLARRHAPLLPALPPAAAPPGAGGGRRSGSPPAPPWRSRRSPPPPPTATSAPTSPA